MQTNHLWKGLSNGKIQFRNKMFVEIARDLNVRFDIDLSFKSEALSKTKFIGSFDEHPMSLKYWKYSKYQSLLNTTNTHEKNIKQSFKTQ